MLIGHGTRLKRSPGKALLHRWLFLLVCAFLSGVLTGVVLLVRPPVVQVQAVVRFDPQRYRFAVVQTSSGPALQPALEKEAREFISMSSPADLQALASIGRPLVFQAAKEPAGDGERPVLVVLGRSADPARAYEIASHGATALGGAMQSLQGWELLRTLLRQTVYLQGQGKTPETFPLTPHLFDLLNAGLLIYDLSIPPASKVATLSTQDVDDITLAIQRAEARHSARIDALDGQKSHTQDPAEQDRIATEIASLAQEREVLRRTLLTLYRQRGALIQQPGGSSAPEVSLPAGPPQRPAGIRYHYLLAGAAAGLLVGSVLALFDERLDLTGHLRELTAYRGLIWNLVMRDLKSRYKSSLLGYLWSLVNPLLMVAVFTILFKYLLKGDIPNFPVFIIAALLPWNYCANSVSGSVVSVTGQANLVKKVYFPREAIPIAVVLSNLINYLLALPAMIALMLLLNAHFQPALLLFPLIVLIETAFLLGVGLFLSCLNVFFRDTQVIMEVALLAWFFLTPIFYRLSDIADDRQARLVRWLNPMASLVDFYRDIFYLGGVPGWDAIIRTLITALLVLLVGYLFFLRFSPRFGEEL